MTNVFFLFFFLNSGVHLSFHWELWTSCKCLCNLWRQREAPFCFPWSLFWGWNPEEGDFRGCSFSGKGVELLWPHRYASPMFKTIALCWPQGKGWASPNDFWAFPHVAPVYPLSFWLLLHPLDVSHFPVSLQRLFPPIKTSLQFMHVRWAYPPGSTQTWLPLGSLASSSGRPLSIFSECRPHL